jgi:hypothetical protein
MLRRKKPVLEESLPARPAGKSRAASRANGAEATAVVPSAAAQPDVQPSVSEESRTHRIWQNMLPRLCDRWQRSFDVFVREMGGDVPAGHGLGRLDPSAGYTPGNARWMSLSELVARLGVTSGALN